MKSFIVTNYVDPAKQKGYSDLMVLMSAAGYYIGTTFKNEEGFEEPGSRDSGYFRTRKEADAALEELNWNQRLHP